MKKKQRIDRCTSREHFVGFLLLVAFLNVVVLSRLTYPGLSRKKILSKARVDRNSSNIMLEMKSANPKTSIIISEEVNRGKSQKTSMSPQQKHWPMNFSNPHNIQNCLKRPQNLFTTLGGCKISRWVYNHPIDMNVAQIIHHKRWASTRLRKQFPTTYEDCFYQPLDKWLHNASQLSPNDTIYVPINKVEQFVSFTLPQLSVPVVVITSLYHGVPHRDLDPIAEHLLSNEYVVRWFISNIRVHIPSFTQHPKVSPWAYGLNENNRKIFNNVEIRLNQSAVLGSEFVEYRKHVEERATDHHKSLGLVLTYMSLTNTKRSAIPSLKQEQSQRGYYSSLASGRFVFAPDGDRPECHRHYEAIGLGTVPVTELDPFLYRHLANGPVIFQNSNWNVSYWNTTTLKKHNISVVNRNMVFLEYWMEYTEREVGRALNWWDHTRSVPTTLEDIYVLIQ